MKIFSRFLAVIFTFVTIISTLVPVIPVEAYSPPAMSKSLNYPGGYGGGFTNGGIKGDYFSNETLSGTPSFSRSDVRIDFPWGNSLPGGSITNEFKSVPADHFSVRWTGQVIPAFSEVYTFTTTSDEGVRLFIKRAVDSEWTTLIDHWTSHSESNDFSFFNMTAGEKYDIKLEYREGTGNATISLKWASPSVWEEVIDPINGMGINCTDWGTTYTDIAKCARSSFNAYGSSPVPSSDPDGWPMGDCQYVFQESLNQGLGLDPLMRGKISFSFTGKATVSLFGNDGNLTYSYNAVTNKTTGSFYGIDKNVNASNVSFLNSTRNGLVGGPGGIKDFKLMRPTAPDSNVSYAEDTLFLTQMKQALSHFTLLRVNLNNGNQEREWSDRTFPSFFNQNGGDWTPRAYSPESYGHKSNGASWEHKVMLCNETGKDLFINIPIMASGRLPTDTESYVNKLANLIKYGSDGVNPYTSPQANPVYPGLNPNLKVYIELSNEVWNWANDAFRQFWDLDAMTIADADAQNADFAIMNYDNLTLDKNTDGSYKSFYTWRARKLMLRVIQISNIFRGVYGDNLMMSTVRPIFEWQYNNANNTASNPLYFAENYFNNADGLTHVANPHPVNYYLWGGGGATYYGTSNKNGLTTIMPDSSFETPAATDYQANPTSSAWTFEGTAGIASKGSSLNNPSPSPGMGNQCAYIQGVNGVNGSMSTNITFPETQISDVFAVSYKAVNRTKVGTTTADTQRLYAYWDGTNISARTYSNGLGVQPPGYDSANPWKSRNVAWTWSEYYFTKIVHAQPGSTHTFKLEGVSKTGDQMAFIDDVRVTSVDALYASGVPDGGQAAGQVNSATYQYGLNGMAIWAKNFGLNYISYEGGWSLGGDDGGSPLQNFAKYGDSRTATANEGVIDDFYQSGGVFNVFGTYSQWPSWSDTFAEQGLVDASKYPLIQGVDNRSNQLRAPVENGMIMPGTIDGATCVEKSFATGPNQFFRVNAVATYSLNLSHSGYYKLNLKMSTKYNVTTLRTQVNGGQGTITTVAKNPVGQDASGNSIITINAELEKGLNVFRVVGKGTTDSNIVTLNVTEDLSIPTPSAVPTPSPTPAPTPTPTPGPVFDVNSTMVVNGAPAGMKMEISEPGSGYVSVVMKLKGQLNINSFSFAIGYDKTKVVPVKVAEPRLDAPNSKLSAPDLVSPYFTVISPNMLVGYNLSSFQMENTTSSSVGNYIFVGYAKNSGATISLDGTTTVPMLKFYFRKIGALDQNTFSYYHKTIASTVVSKLVYRYTNVLQSETSTGSDIYTRSDLFTKEILQIGHSVTLSSLTAGKVINTGDAVYDQYMNSHGVSSVSVKASYLSSAILAETVVDPTSKTAIIPALSDGNYVLSVTRDGYLTRRVNLNMNGSDVSLGEKSLVAGDVFVDGVIDGSDSEFLFSTIGNSYGHLGYDPSCDFNQDGTIDGTDTEILFTHLGFYVMNYGERINYFI